jgi:hypothetical protein
VPSQLKETAKENFSVALEEYITGLTLASSHDPRNVSGARGACFKAYAEAVIVTNLNTAHAHRDDLLKKMDDANSRWDRHYK